VAEASGLDELRDFFRLYLGDDWEVMLILAGAIASPDASHEQVHAAQQRAVTLVRDHHPGLSGPIADLIAKAWLALWMSATP
jgi:hypothetical protein